MDQNEYDAQMLNEDQEIYRKIRQRGSQCLPTFERFSEEFRNRGLAVTEFPNNLLDFKGEVTDDEGVRCNVEGSFELADDNRFYASAIWSTATAETDGETFKASLDSYEGSAQDIAAQVVSDIILPGFPMSRFEVSKSDVMIQLQHHLAEMGLMVTFTDKDIIEASGLLKDREGTVVYCTAEFDVLPDLSATLTVRYIPDADSSTGTIHKSLSWEGDAYAYAKELIPTVTVKDF